MSGNMLVVVGAQLGSEGKGAIVSYLANDYNVHVRVGGPNAGHTIFYEGEKYKMQIIPCGWTNPDAWLVVGRGAIINLDILMNEIFRLEKVFPKIRERILIDRYAGILSREFVQEEGHTEGELNRRIGSTGEGVGAARVARINRDPSKFKRMVDLTNRYGLHLYDTASLINGLHKDGSNVLLEGTQGSGLSLIHGPWPYVTSADTNASQLIADCGISPLAVNKILLVARTFPIRVAGNSGPLKGEINWDDMSTRLGKEVVEHTTVTKKVRRIGKWDENLMIDAVGINRPTSIALTFLDYLEPKDEGKTDYNQLSSTSIRFIEYLEHDFAPVSLIKTGEADECIIQRREV